MACAGDNSASVKSRCSGCCVLDKRCDSCVRCLPRRLCVSVEVTPGAYSTSNGDCCRFEFNLYYGCDTGWIGSGSCPTTTVALGLEVNLVNVYDVCHIEVAAPGYLDEVLIFEAVGNALPDEMVFEVPETDQTGDSYVVTITKPDVVENPLWTDRCSPCSCVSCLPRKVCVTIYEASHDITRLCGFWVRGVFEWDCDSRSWLGDPLTISQIDGDDTFEVDLHLLPVEDQVCGARIIVTGPGGLDSTISFEGALHPRKIHGTACRGNENFIMGVPELLPCPPEDPECEDPPPQNYNEFGFSGILYDDYGINIGTISVSDMSCGTCVAAPISVPCLPCGDFPEVFVGTVRTAVDCTDPYDCTVDGLEIEFTFDPCAEYWVTEWMDQPCDEGLPPAVLRFILVCEPETPGGQYTWKLTKAYSTGGSETVVIDAGSGGTFTPFPLELDGFESTTMFSFCHGDPFGDKTTRWNFIAA